MVYLAETGEKISDQEYIQKLIDKCISSEVKIMLDNEFSNYIWTDMMQKLGKR